MADPRAIAITDGVSQVRLSDPSGLALRAPLLEIGPAQALVATDHPFAAGSYLDVEVSLKGQPLRRFFASVIGREERGLRLRWNHLDPGDEAKLLGLLAAYARDLQGGGTRRLIRPKTAAAFQPSGGEAAPAPADTGKHTRRLIRPSSRLPAPGAPPPAGMPAPSTAPEPAEADELAPHPLAPAGEESRLSPVVIATTEQYERLSEAAPSAPAAPASAASTAGPNDAAPPATVAASESAPSPSGDPAPTVKDGRLDVGAAIRARAKTVRASELAARHERVRVLNMATIKQLIQEAVAEAAQHLARALGEAERKRLLEEAEEGFRERLKAFEREKQSAEERARALQAELAAARELLAAERKRTIQAEQFTVSEAGLADLDERMTKIIERALARGEVDASLELRLRELVAHVLDSEREKLRQKELAAQSEKIALLERKVARLAQSLEETERERDEARRIAEAMEREGLTVQEVRNKYRIGLAEDDPQRERKLALMRELAEHNRELRRQLGIATRSPEEVAAELAAEAERRRREAEARRAEAAEPPSAELDASPAEEPPGAAQLADAVGGAGGAGAADGAEVADDAPLVNPDDLPWEPEPVAPPPPERATDERGVKVVRDYQRFEPPPLATPPAAAEPSEADAGPTADAPLVNPDDLPWEPEPVAPPPPDRATDERGVKVVRDYQRFEPPPLSTPPGG